MKRTLILKAAMLGAVYCAVAAQSCPEKNPVTPTLVLMDGFGKWDRPWQNLPDRFRFSVRPATICAPGGNPCDQQYPDTAFVDFSIPSATSFEVSSGPELLVQIGDAAPLGDYQYRRAQLDDGSGSNTTWRIALSVPKMLRNPNAAREWCGPTTFPFEIVNVSGQKKSGPLRLAFVWGYCQSTGTVGPTFWYASGKQGTPKQSSPPPPTGDCPGGGFARAFDVCERCGSSGLSTAKTFWGCTLAEAQSAMGQPGCPSTLRTGPNCP